ncbi:MAG: response regulator [Anaerolineaceae bacterium]|nr:response regulator [Anaerolineaceae bacterium]
MTKVLYIEDNPQNMRLVHKILADAGYEVVEAKNGVSGVDAVEQEKPDLVLMDVNLPDIKGFEVVARIKAKPTLTAIPLIALTANASSDDREKCLAAGYDGYLAKPVMKKELLNAVADFLK